MEDAKNIDESLFKINNEKRKRQREQEEQSRNYLDKNYSKKWLKNYFAIK